MATKNNPGVYDCFTKAEPDEPMFVLLGRDPTAPMVLAFWVELRKRLDATGPVQIEEALRCAASMEDWARKLGKDDAVDLAWQAFRATVIGVEQL